MTTVLTTSHWPNYDAALHRLPAGSTLEPYAIDREDPPGSQTLFHEIATTGKGSDRYLGWMKATLPDGRLVIGGFSVSAMLVDTAGVEQAEGLGRDLACLSIWGWATGQIEGRPAKEGDVLPGHGEVAVFEAPRMAAGETD